jgi:hypothetical protein
MTRGAPSNSKAFRQFVRPSTLWGEQPLRPAGPQGAGHGEVLDAGLEVLPAGVDRADHDFVAEHEAQVEGVGGDLDPAVCPGCEYYLAQIRQTIALTGKLTEEALLPNMRDRLLEAFRTWKQA